MKPGALNWTPSPASSPPVSPYNPKDIYDEATFATPERAVSNLGLVKGGYTKNQDVPKSAPVCARSFQNHA